MSRMKKSHRLCQAAATLMQISARREKHKQAFQWIDQMVKDLTQLAEEEERYERTNPQGQRQKLPL